MQASYPPDKASAPPQERILPLEDWDVLFRAALDRLRGAIASKQVDVSVRTCVLDCVEALDLLRQTLPVVRDPTNGA